MMRRGVIDQVLMLMMVFVFLVTIFFLVIDYASVGKVQNQLDMMARQGSRLVSLGKSAEKVATMINALKTNYFRSVTADDVVCATSENGKAKVFFNIEGSFQSRFDVLGDDGRITVTSQSVAYNEYSSDEINCSVILQRQEGEGNG